MRRRTTASICEIKNTYYLKHISNIYYILFLNFAHICYCSLSHCDVPALKFIHVLSLQASSDSDKQHRHCVLFFFDLIMIACVPAIEPPKNS